MKIIFLVIVVINIILGFVTGKLTEEERTSPFIGPHIPFILLKMYKQNKNVYLLVLFIIDLIFLLVFIISLPIFFFNYS